MFRSLSFLALCLSPLTTSAQQADEMMDIPQGKLFLSEEFLTLEETIARVKAHGNSFLRRGLQSSPNCRAMTPLNVVRQEGEYCSALAPYPCSCDGISEELCYYCAIRPEPNQISCQVSGTSLTFMDHTDTVTTCGCEYLGNGQHYQFCYQPSGPVPIPPPAVVIEPAVAPVAPRAPFGVASPTGNGGNGGNGNGGNGGNGGGKGKGKGSNK